MNARCNASFADAIFHTTASWKSMRIYVWLLIVCVTANLNAMTNLYNTSENAVYFVLHVETSF